MSSGEAAWTLIDSAGVQLHSVALPGEALLPVRGLPRGLAVRTPGGGLARYDLETQQLTDISGEQGAWIGDVSTDRFAWCQTDPCAALQVADADGEPRTSVGGVDEEFGPGGVWLSPDGVSQAAWVRVDVGGGQDLRLRVYDVASGQVRADTQTILGSVYGQWREDGEQFFFRVHAQGGPSLLGRWAGGERIEQADVRALDLGDANAFVALPETAVEGLFRVSEED